MKRKGTIATDIMKMRRTATRDARLAAPQPRAARIPAKKGAGSYKRADKHRNREDG